MDPRLHFLRVNEAIDQITFSIVLTRLKGHDVVDFDDRSKGKGFELIRAGVNHRAIEKDGTRPVIRDLIVNLTRLNFMSKW